MFEKIKAEYRASLKSRDTEENIDLMFYRPLGFLWACLFRKLGVSPNAVTIASIFIGIAAGICFYYTNIWINCLGIFFLVWANTYDSCDGQLARLTGQHSQLGRILDGVAGDFWFISIYVAICLRTNANVEFFAGHSWLVWTLAVSAGLCHVVQAAVADRYRQFHLFFLKGASGSELDSSAELKARYEALSWSGNFFNKLVLFVYSTYTTIQEAITPNMQALCAQLAAVYGTSAVPADKAEEFRRMSFPLCKWENFMTFNWRTIFLYASVLSGMPWCYFVVELTLFNIVLVYTICTHESICRCFRREI